MPWTREVLGAVAPGGPASAAAPVSGAPPSADALRATGPQPAVAFYYGEHIPFDELGAFDWVVVQPGAALAESTDIGRAFGPSTQPFAYVSVGEIAADDPRLKTLPPAWFGAGNPAWNTRVVDQTAAGWSEFLRERVVAPLWKAGFRGFFLDTLDSYQLLAKGDAQRRRQADALRRTLHELVAAFPGVRLILNRGFELVDSGLAASIDAVAAESLYRGWDQRTQAYVEVAPADREWLLARLRDMREHFALPGIAIDYCAPSRRDQARQVASRIAAHGLIPWVTDAQLDALGVGNVEVVPRRVLLLHSCEQGDSPQLQAQDAHVYGAMPLEYLGLVPEYHYVGAPLPQQPLAGRYAAVVLYPDSSEVPRAVDALLRRARDEGVPVAALGALAPRFLAGLGVQVGEDALAGPVELRRAPGTPPGEILPMLDALSTVELGAGAQAQVWLAAVGSDGRQMQGAAITPWGGYALGSFGVFNLPGGNGTRWSVDPIEFFRAALRIGDDPMPDLSTRCGRRVLMVHFDGDGWPNACLRPGSPIAGQVLVTEVLEKYRIPTVGSIIVGEVSDDGLYPKLAPQSQHWARRMYALPWIEAASHTWSHPFDWVLASRYHARFPTGKGYSTYGNYLPLPNYRFSTSSNVIGAREYIEKHLCPPGKPCDMLLWPGDCNPPVKAVQMTYAAGMANLNGGGASITRSAPSLTLVAPMGIPKGSWFQVYAACSNEEAYTHDWHGPYFGFERAIETYEMTDSPRRLKPIGIYFHPYIVTREAGLQSLHKVFGWALAQAAHPIYGRQYSQAVVQWRRATVARRLGGGWRLRGAEQIRQWTQPLGAAAPELERCAHVVGWNEHGPRRYLHVQAADAVLRTGAAPLSRPMLVDANADVVSWEAAGDGAQRVRLQGFVPVDAVLRLPAGWSVARAPGATLRRRDGQWHVHGASTSLDLLLRRA